jgi:hypothetical protein
MTCTFQLFFTGLLFMMSLPDAIPLEKSLVELGDSAIPWGKFLVHLGNTVFTFTSPWG